MPIRGGEHDGPSNGAGGGGMAVCPCLGPRMCARQGGGGGAFLVPHRLGGSSAVTYKAWGFIYM